MEGRALPQEEIVFGNKTVKSNEQADWGRDATREQVVSAVNLSKWLIQFTKREQQIGLSNLS